jgi:hypothetical protein
MTILDQLSSQVGERTQAANRKVVTHCLTQPASLAEVAEGFKAKDAALLGDCAEVMTQVAEQQPTLVAPYAKGLLALLAHKTTRVRWEAMHALALVAAHAPKVMRTALPRLEEIIHTDPSIIVRDYAVDALGNYAATGKAAAEKTYPLLKEALTLWEGKHAGHALKGLANVSIAAPYLRDEIRACGFPYLDHGKGVIRKAAKALMKAIESEKK